MTDDERRTRLEALSGLHDDARRARSPRASDRHGLMIAIGLADPDQNDPERSEELRERKLGGVSNDETAQTESYDRGVAAGGPKGMGGSDFEKLPARDPGNYVPGLDADESDQEAMDEAERRRSMPRSGSSRI